MQEYPHISFQKNWRLDEETIFMLGQCESIIQAISSAPVKPDSRKEILVVSLRKGARATTAIEGNTLSEEEVARIDAGENLPASKEYLQFDEAELRRFADEIGIAPGIVAGHLQHEEAIPFNQANGLKQRFAFA